MRRRAGSKESRGRNEGTKSAKGDTSPATAHGVRKLGDYCGPLLYYIPKHTRTHCTTHTHTHAHTSFLWFEQAAAAAVGANARRLPTAKLFVFERVCAPPHVRACRVCECIKKERDQMCVCVYASIIKREREKECVCVYVRTEMRNFGRRGLFIFFRSNTFWF